MRKQDPNSPSRRPRMNAGALAPFVEKFAEHLTGLGHSRLTVAGLSDSARHFANWLCRAGIAASDVADRVLDEFAHHRCHCPGGQRGRLVSPSYLRRVQRFVQFLAESGVVASSAPAYPKPAVDPHITEFLEWLRCHRGISEPTLRLRGHVMRRLLPALGNDPAIYDAALVRRVILEEARRSSPSYVRTMTMTLRGYLRFLTTSGCCRPWLDHAVPTVPHWRLSALPRYLPMADIERLITSCDVTTPAGIRDRAILLLLARLGLRAGDVLAMRFDDIDWTEGTLRVCGKSRREVCLPLPQDAGDALLDYLTRARPKVGYDRIFLRAIAPYRPVRSISSVVRLGLERAGITDAPSRGARLLRHSAATGMLRAGVTLDAVGVVLRHRSTDTTMHYAKVDVAMLRPIAQPWLGDVPC
jgi:integrase/recombinase XerD